MPNVTDYKNAHYSADGSNQVDLDILTDEYGWIPTTIIVDDNDSELHILQIKEWIAGNADLIGDYVAPVISTEDRITSIAQAVQTHLDTEAKSKGYDSIHTAVTYADEPANPIFQSEGQALRAWRSNVWASCYTLLAQWEAGTIPEPTINEVILQLPVISYA